MISDERGVMRRCLASVLVLIANANEETQLLSVLSYKF
jgi:hypothetical protein